MKTILSIVKQNKVSIGVAVGFVLGSGVSKLATDREPADIYATLEVKHADVVRMMQNDQIAIYDTPNGGRMFVAMEAKHLDGV